MNEVNGSTTAEELAGELRAIIEGLAVRQASEEDLRAALDAGREIRERLEHAPRSARWYDGGAQNYGKATPASRAAYLDQSPIRGRLNPIAPPLVLDRTRAEDGGPEIVGRTVLGSAYEGPPHGVHGGWVAALFDDLLGATQGLAESAGVTAKLTIRYRSVTPLDRELRFRAWIHEERGRRIVSRATCHAGDTLTADAEALFVRVDFNELEASMHHRREAHAQNPEDADG